MDQAMVKRGIGAVVLAIIAALLLGYLLKDKSRERQEVVDMKLPDSAEMSIPDLSVTGEDVAIIDDAGNNIGTPLPNEKNTIVASADAIASAASKTTPGTNIDKSNTNDPGFSIRPSGTNETREIVDPKAAIKTPTEGSAAIAYSTDPVNEVIASSKKAEKKFKPSIVEEKHKAKPKKKVTHKTTQKAVKKPVKTAAAKPQKTQVAKPAPAPVKPAASAAIGNKPLGKYSIQLLATSSESRANKLAATMKSEGYKVFITRAQSHDKVLFRVRVGGHANRDQAVKAQDSMKRRYQKNFFVQNSLVVSN